jgi:hypothetical protein
MFTEMSGAFACKQGIYMRRNIVGLFLAAFLSAFICASNQLPAADKMPPPTTNDAPQRIVTDGALLSPKSPTQSDSMLAKASADFQLKKSNRVAEAKALLPALKTGMDKNSVIALCGIPDEERDNGAHWFYSLFYSQFLEISFDDGGKVVKIVSTVSSGN